jgi:hypothetical protein
LLRNHPDSIFWKLEIPAELKYGITTRAYATQANAANGDTQSLSAHLGDWNSLQGIESEIRDVSTDFGESRVHNIFDAADCDRSFSDVCRQHDLECKEE